MLSPKNITAHYHSLGTVSLKYLDKKLMNAHVLNLNNS